MEHNTRLADILATTEQRSASRACFLLHVKPEVLEEYVEVHQHVWEEMRDALHSAGWRHYSLFVDPVSGLVVGYFESEDTDTAMRAIASTNVNTRWQQAMARYFLPPDGGQAHLLHQYFYLP